MNPSRHRVGEPLEPMHRRSRLLAAAAALVVAASAAVATSVTQAAESNRSPLRAASTLSVETAQRTQLPDNPRRPDVYLAYHGSEQLLGNRDHLWPYVRANLDGLWANPFVPVPDTFASLSRAIELTRKVETRNLIVEHPIANGSSCEGFRNDWYQTEVEKLAPDIRYNRVAAAIYAGTNPNCWGAAGGISHGMNVYRNQGYDTVYTLYQPQNLGNSVNSASFPTISPGSSGDIAYRNSGGVVLECPIDACTDPTFGAPFWQAIQEAHARGVPFVWFTGPPTAYGRGTSGWLAQVQATYNIGAFFGLWRSGDKIVLINYHGAYPSLPEANPDGSPADTTTGVLRWLLTQAPVQSLCTTAC